MQDALGGVLCRCTGYRKIVEAVLDVVRGRAGCRRRRRGRRAGSPRSTASAKLTGREQFGADALPDQDFSDAARDPQSACACALHARRFRGTARGASRARARADGRRRSRATCFGIYPDREGSAGARRRHRAPSRRAGLRAGRRCRDAARHRRRRRADHLDAPAGQSRSRMRWRRRRCTHHAPDNVLCRGRVARGDVDGGARIGRGARRDRTCETTFRRARLYRARSRLCRAASATASKIVACTQTPYMDRDELAPHPPPRARTGARRADGRRRRLRRQARPVACSRSPPSPHGGSIVRCAWSTRARKA